MSKKDELFKDSRKKGVYSDLDELRRQLEGEEEGGGDESSIAQFTAESDPDVQEPSSASSSKSEGADTQDEPPASQDGPERATKRLNLEIDANVHRQFKGLVGMQGRTMTDVIEEFMRSYVDNARQELL